MRDSRARCKPAKRVSIVSYRARTLAQSAATTRSRFAPLMARKLFFFPSHARVFISVFSPLLGFARETQVGSSRASRKNAPRVASRQHSAATNAYKALWTLGEALDLWSARGLSYNTVAVNKTRAMFVGFARRFSRVHHFPFFFCCVLCSLPRSLLFRRVLAFGPTDGPTMNPAPPATARACSARRIGRRAKKRNKRPVKKYDGFQVRLMASRTLSTGETLLLPHTRSGLLPPVLLLFSSLRPSPSITSPLPLASSSSSAEPKRTID